MAIAHVSPFTPACARRTSCRVICQASTASNTAVSRRASIFTALVPALATVASPALALLDYDDDEEMISKAKARRAERLQQERETQRSFIKSEGLRDLRDRDLIPVQNGVYKLAKSGAQLEAGDVSSASVTLKGDWVADFEKAVGSLSGSTGSKDKLLSSVRSLSSAAASGDLFSAKREYVATVDAVLSWSKDVGVTDSLKGL